MQYIWKDSNTIAIDAMGTAGGLAIIWDPSRISLQNLMKTPWYITADFNSIDTGTEGVVTGVYGPSTPLVKGKFLESFLNIADKARGKHWIAGEDFNLITNLLEKKGGTRHLDAHATKFAEVIHQVKVVDVMEQQENMI